LIKKEELLFLFFILYCRGIEDSPRQRGVGKDFPHAFGVTATRRRRGAP